MTKKQIINIIGKDNFNYLIIRPSIVTKYIELTEDYMESGLMTKEDGNNTVLAYKTLLKLIEKEINND